MALLRHENTIAREYNFFFYLFNAFVFLAVT
jgi:hypothetical protein